VTESAEDLLARGKALVGEKKYAEALSLLQHVTQLAPGSLMPGPISDWPTSTQDSTGWLATPTAGRSPWTISRHGSGATRALHTRSSITPKRRWSPTSGRPPSTLMVPSRGRTRVPHSVTSSGIRKHWRLMTKPQRSIPPMLSPGTAGVARSLGSSATRRRWQLTTGLRCSTPPMPLPGIPRE
jgi:hypothetical protein